MARERILIADDENDVLDTCVRALSVQGYQVTAVHSGFEAIEMAKEQDFDLMLTDIKMPGITGLQAFRTIRQHRPEILGVAITGYGAVDTAIEALKSGMNDFLLKPFSLEELRSAVGKALEKKRLEQENVRLKALIPLYELSQAFMAVTSNLDALLQQVMQLGVQATGASQGILMLLSSAKTDSRPEVRSVVTETGTQATCSGFVVDPLYVNQAVQTKKPVIWQAGPDVKPLFAEGTANADVSAGVVCPLVFNGEAIGALALSKRQPGATFSQSELELVSVLASNSAVAIQNSSLFAHIRESYDRLKELDRMKSEFVSNVSHELRAPLHTISGFVQLLLDGKVADETTRTECLETVFRQTQHLTQLIDDLLDVSRMEAGKLELHRETVQLIGVIAEVVKEMQALAAQRQISLTDEVPADLPTVFADANRLGQVLRNLVYNAIKFTAAQGHIRVSAQSQTDQVVVAVQDDGVGISAEAKGHLFERFYQADSSSTRRVGGTGLGLYICKQIVEAHGGTVSVESELGRGSTFRFSVPLSQAQC